jgi:hypothetical protein
MYTVGPVSIPLSDPMMVGPLSKLCTVFEEWLADVEVLHALIRKKRPPFIYALHPKKDIDLALQMPGGLLPFPLVAEGGGERWHAKNSIIDFLNLYPQDYIEEVVRDTSALIITYDNLLNTGFTLKDDIPPNIYYTPCLPERLSLIRVVDVFFTRSSANYYTRVRVELPPWANFGYLWMESLKGACSRNFIPISYERQYKVLYTQLTASSPLLIQHGKGYNESGSNNYIDGIIYIPNYEGDRILATQLYCLWLTLLA